MRAKSLAVESDVRRIPNFAILALQSPILAHQDSENLLHFLSRHQGSRCVVILEVCPVIRLVCWDVDSN
jgi:hypothetical protein